MDVLHTPWLNAALALVVNLPFGYWRAGARKFSGAWFVAIHLPIILTVGTRLLLGMHFRLVTLPLYALAFVSGQSLGALARRRLRGSP